MKFLIVTLSMVLSFAAHAQDIPAESQSVQDEMSEASQIAVKNWSRVVALCRENAASNIAKRCGVETSRKMAELMQSETAILGFQSTQYGETRTPGFLWKKAVVDLRYLSEFNPDVARALNVEAISCRNVDNSMRFECATGPSDQLELFWERKI